MRDIGTMGESHFSFICASMGLVANGSRVDKTGWDFYVEFPQKYNESLHLDLVPPPIECKIQVKSTDSQTGKVQITLSNLLRLVKSPCASFIYFIEFDNKQFAQNSFLVHIDNDLIFKVLKRVRELSVEDSDVKLNKKTMTINYSSLHKLNSVSGWHLSEKIEDYIKYDFKSYVNNKMKFLDTVGYENGVVSLKFRMAGSSNLESLVDSSLGIERRIAVQDVSAVDIRFGIDHSVKLFTNSDGYMSVVSTQEPSQGKIIFRDGRYSNPLIFDCKLYISSLGGVLYEKSPKIRLEGAFFNIIFNFSNGRANYDCSLDSVSLSLIELRKSLQLMELVLSGKKGVTLQFDFSGFPKSIVDIEVEKQSLNLLQSQELVDNAVLLANYFDISLDVKTTLNVIGLQRKYISEMVALINADPSSATMVFETKDEIEMVMDSICLLKLFSYDFLEFKIYSFVVFAGNVTELDIYKYDMNIQSMRVLRKFYALPGSFLLKEDVIAIEDEIHSILKDEFEKVLLIEGME